MPTTVRRATLVVMALVVLLAGLPVHRGTSLQGPPRIDVLVTSYEQASDNAGLAGHHDQDERDEATPDRIAAPVAPRPAPRGCVDWVERSFSVDHPGFGLDRPPRLASLA